VPFQPNPNGDDGNGGVTLKLAKTPAKNGNFPVFQAEWSISSSTGTLWYDLSAVDGDPVSDVERHMQVGPDGTCEVLNSGPGNTEAEWPYQPVCSSGLDVYIWLC
jgi:hypothetical protein